MRCWMLFALLLASCTPPALPVSVELSEPAALTFATRDGNGSGLLYLSETRPAPAVIVLHGDHGLNESIRKNAERLQGAGYNVLAIDLYRGEKVDGVLDAHILDRGLPTERVRGDIVAAVQALEQRPEVRKGPVGIIGWDMGGGLALDTAMVEPRLGAVVTCYGRLTTDAKMLATLNGPVLGIFAEQDEGNPPETLQAFALAMKKAGKRVVGPHRIRGAAHGFMNPVDRTNGIETGAQVQQAWDEILKFFATELGAG